MYCRVLTIFAVLTLFIVARGLSVAAAFQRPSRGPAQTPIEIAASEREEIASDASFLSALRLLVRQWSFGDHSDYAVMSAYRLDDELTQEQRAELADILLNASESSESHVRLLTRQPTRGGDFVGRHVEIRTPPNTSIKSEDLLEAVLSQGREILMGKDGELGQGIYLATPKAVEGLEPETDIVFFDLVPSGSKGPRKQE